jgi:acetyl esterase/lipase
MRASGGLVTRVLAAVCALASLLHPAPLPAQSEPDPPIAHVYREIGGDSLRAYVFLPPERGAGDKASAILLFHGGGWSVGAPEWTFATARRFADSGLVAVAVQYRLSTGGLTPIEALADACAAFAWIRARAAEFGLTGQVAGYGVSAGGHLVAATVTIGCPDDGAGPDALLLWSPALDPVGDGWFTGLLQGRATAPDLSPARHVGPSTPPTSIVHGERDTLTPLAGVRRYCAALAALGRRCELHVYPGVGHLLTRNLANQESDFDPDPVARADGIAQHHRFLRSLGFVPDGGQR